MKSSPAVMRSRAIGYWVIGIAGLAISYVLAARGLGTVTSETGPQVCGPAVIGRMSPLPAPECGPYLENFTSFAGIALVIGTFLLILGLVNRAHAGRRVRAYRY